MERLRPILADLLVPEGVCDLPQNASKHEVVTRLGEMACAAAGVQPDHVKAVLDALWDRELILSTGIGLGIAVPHVRHANVPREALRVGRVRGGMPFDAIDGRPVEAVFAILMPAGNHRRHVEVMAGIAAAVKDENRRQTILAAPDSAAFVARMLAPR